MYTLAQVKEELQRLGVFPKKSLGQNFLINADSCQKILNSVRRLNFESIVEVGPGLGALTEPLISLQKELILIELDKEFAKLWRDRGCNVIEDDALQIDWHKLGLTEPTLLVSNLPYQISSSLLVDRSVDPAGVKYMALMFQKEVAQRILSPPKEKSYGMLSVIAQSHWKIQKLFEISSKDFYPPPQVASQVLIFEKRDGPSSGKYLSFVKSAFAQRRKFLLKNLKAQTDVEKIEAAFEKNSISLKARAEDLTPEIFQMLFEDLRENLK